MPIKVLLKNMKIIFPKIQIIDPEQSIRRCGYGLKIDRYGGGRSYTRHPDRTMLYPRFHVYVEDKGENWLFNLHLDQRAPVYKGVKAHAGEKDGEVVEREGERIKNMLTKNPTS